MKRLPDIKREAADYARTRGHTPARGFTHVADVPETWINRCQRGQCFALTVIKADPEGQYQMGGRALTVKCSKWAGVLGWRQRKDAAGG